MPIDSSVKGVFAIAATPFLPSGQVDYDSVDRLTDFYQEAEVDGITILGIMGEAQKLDPEEAREIVYRVTKRSKVPVIVGVSAPGLAAMESLSRSAMDAGAAGVMIAPHSNLKTDDQIVSYFGQCVEAIGEDTPFVIQDYPLVLNVVMAPSVIRTIVQNHPSCVMLKHEDWPGLEKISALRRFQAAGTMREISILCGNGGLFLDFETERGADGAMTGYAFPEMLVDVVRHQRAGERDKAHDLFDAHLPLLRYEQQAGIGLAVRKHVLHRRKAIAHSHMRKPAIALSEEARAEVDYLLRRLAKHDKRAII